jgi:DNA-3-methyladenine glycosylase
VTGPDGEASAVLLRAAEPVAGIDLMRARRGRPREPASRLAAGPGRLGVALGIDRSFSGADLRRGPLRVVEGGHLLGGAASPPLAVGPRIGVAYAGEPWVSLPWRFRIAGHPSVSR